MAVKRKKWQLRYRGTATTDTFNSQKKAYEFIQSLASAYFADPGSTDPNVYVWVDEGDGRWQRYEDLVLSDLTQLNPARAAKEK